MKTKSNGSELLFRIKIFFNCFSEKSFALATKTMFVVRCRNFWHGSNRAMKLQVAAQGAEPPVFEIRLRRYTFAHHDTDWLSKMIVDRVAGFTYDEHDRQSRRASLHQYVRGALRRCGTVVMWRLIVSSPTFVMPISWVHLLASVAQRQSVRLGIERSRVRNSRVPSGFSLKRGIHGVCPQLSFLPPTDSVATLYYRIHELRSQIQLWRTVTLTSLADETSGMRASYPAATGCCGVWCADDDDDDRMNGREKNNEQGFDTAPKMEQ